MNNVIVLFGKPGAGKGTRLSEFLEGKEDSFETISVGNLLRKARKEQSDIGKKAEFYMNSGKLVPDEIINELVIDGIKSTSKTVFLDGYPRTIGQAAGMLESGIVPKKVIHFYVDDEVVVGRARSRIVCEDCGEPYTLTDFKPPKKDGICDKCSGRLIRRKDDEESVVKARIETYNTETYPVLDFLESNGVKIYNIDNSEPLSARERFAALFT